MQLPFSEPDPTPAGVSGSSAPDHRGVADASAAQYSLAAPATATADPSITAIVLAEDRFLPLPQFAPHIPDDPTPAKEDQAEAWVKEMCKHARIWRRNLMRLTREFDSEKLKQEFTEMYNENTDATAADFLQRHFAGQMRLPTPSRSPSKSHFSTFLYAQAWQRSSWLY